MRVSSWTVPPMGRSEGYEAAPILRDRNYALGLCNKIEAAWRAVGVTDVRAHVVEVKQGAWGQHSEWLVRSNLINGLPPSASQS